MRNYTRKTNRGLVPLELMHAAAYQVRNGQSMRKVAREMNICHATLFRFLRKLKSGENPTIGYKAKLLFNAAQEEEIVKCLAEYSKVFCGLTLDDLRKLACGCVKRLNYPNIPQNWTKTGKGSKDWAAKFVQRNGLNVKLKDTDDIHSCYNRLHKLIEDYKFLPSRIYHVTDISIAKVVCKNGRTTSDKPVNMQFAANAIGETIPPFFVTNEYKTDTNIIRNSTGEMTAKEFPRYLNHFIKHTNPSDSEPVLLILDYQQYYVDVNVLERANANSILLLPFPKSNNKLFKKIAKTVMDSCKSAQVDEIRSKSDEDCDIVKIASGVAKEVAKSDIVRCFKKSGVWPFNPTVVTGEEFVPSAVHEFLMPRRRAKQIRKLGNHTELEMRRAMDLIKSGLSVRQASLKCQLSYSTVRRYHQVVNNNQGKDVRLTPNYEVNRIFSVEEEIYIAKYLKFISKQLKEELTSKDCRRVAYQVGSIIRKKMPQKWLQEKSAGSEWLRSFKLRHPGVCLRKHKAGDLVKETVLDLGDMEAFFEHLKLPEVPVEVKVRLVSLIRLCFLT